MDKGPFHEFDLTIPLISLCYKPEHSAPQSRGQCCSSQSSLGLNTEAWYIVGCQLLVLTEILYLNELSIALWVRLLRKGDSPISQKWKLRHGEPKCRVLRTQCREGANPLSVSPASWSSVSCLLV